MVTQDGSIVLAVITCDSHSYRILLDRHNLVFCECNGWYYNGHECKHLEMFRQQLVNRKGRKRGSTKG